MMVVRSLDQLEARPCLTQDVSTNKFNGRWRNLASELAGPMISSRPEAEPISARRSPCSPRIQMHVCRSEHCIIVMTEQGCRVEKLDLDRGRFQSPLANPIRSHILKLRFSAGHVMRNLDLGIRSDSCLFPVAACLPFFENAELC